MGEEKRIILFPYKEILIFTILIIALTLFLKSFQHLGAIYIPIIISYFLAFILNPVVTGLEDRGFGRAGPSIFLLFSFFLAIFSASVLLLPKLLVQLREFMDNVPSLIDKITVWLTPISEKYFGYNIFSDWSRFIVDILPSIQSLPGVSVVQNFFLGTAHALGALVVILIIPILTFYMLKDYPTLNGAMLKLIPRRYLSTVKDIFTRLSIVLGALLRGQLLVCLILATFYSIALSTAGVQLSLFLGFFGGFMNLIPFVGPLAAMLITILISVIHGASLLTLAVISTIFLLGNVLDNMIFTPKIIGRQMGINPLTIILVLLAGAELLGVLGMLLALPVTAMVKVLGSYLIENYFNSGYYKKT